MGAKVGAAGGDAGFDDGRAAAWARLALTPKDSGKVDVTAPLALGIHVVTIC